MGDYAKVIDAVYENGVFKPPEDIELKEHERVSLEVINHEEWSKRFNEIIGRIGEKTSKFSSEELEADIERKSGEKSVAVKAVIDTNILVSALITPPTNYPQVADRQGK